MYDVSRGPCFLFLRIHKTKAMTQAPSRQHQGGSVLVLVLVLFLNPIATSSYLLSPAFTNSRRLSSSPPPTLREAAELVHAHHSGSPPTALKNENNFQQLEEDLLKKPELNDSDLHQLFDGYKEAFSKNYKPREDMEHRFNLFVATVERVRSHNAAAATGEYSYTTGLSEFADMTQEEKNVANRAMVETPQESNLNNGDDYYCDDYENLGEEHLLLNGEGPGNTTSRNLLAGTNATTSPDLGVPFEQHVRRARKTVDWAEQGTVTQPGYQGRCGSCWAFAAVAAVESARFKKTGVLEKLAVQPLVDCIPSYGCKGGKSLVALNTILEWGGLMTEASYPYTGKEGKCRVDEFREEDMVELPFDEWRAVKDDEASLKLAISQHPGVVVSVRISREEIDGYRGGIYDGCEQLDSTFFSKNEDGIARHAMQLVGYGSEGEGEDKKKYWLLKNSWGNHGENGYMRILRGSKRSWRRGFRKGNCDITHEAIVIGKMKRFLGERLGREAAWENKEEAHRMMMAHTRGQTQRSCRRKGKKNKKKRQKNSGIH